MRRFVYTALMFALLISLSASAAFAQEGNPGDTDIPQITPRIYLPYMTASAADASLDFAALSTDLLQMEAFFSGGSGQPVIFDAEAARSQGFPPESIALAEELAAHTNALISAAEANLKEGASADVVASSVDLSSFPKVSAYFALATENEQNGGEVEPAGWCNSALTDAACSCGHWSYPRPTTAAPWKDLTSSNPANTLRSWGYHETPGWAGGGWTRPQTYYSSRCGNNTFRDHAYTVSSTKFREQNYSGYTPRGEPNPEFWASGPWPYGAWPSYVQWWHSTH